MVEETEYDDIVQCDHSYDRWAGERIKTLHDMIFKFQNDFLPKLVYSSVRVILGLADLSIHIRNTTLLACSCVQTEMSYLNQTHWPTKKMSNKILICLNTFLGQLWKFSISTSVR